LRPLNDLEHALNKSNEQIKNQGISLKDLKVKFKILKEKIIKIADKMMIELKLRRK